MRTLQQTGHIPIIAHDELLDQSRVAKMLKVTEKFLEARRCKGGGPAFIHVGRLVRYRFDDVQAWIQSQRMTSTSGGKP